MKKLLALSAFVAATALNASAAIPTELSGMLTTISTDSASMITTYVVPAVATITGLWIILKLAKRGANKIG